jgi:ribonuclease HII
MDVFEKEAHLAGFKRVAGVDEAGRGPLAGPVVAAAVIFDTLPLDLGIKDSKKLSPGKRAELSVVIEKTALAIGVGLAWPDEIDRVNILKASLLAMKRAVLRLGANQSPDILLIDGINRIDLPVAQKPIVSGDSSSVTIAAASIMAKTFRDSLMDAYHHLYPEYDFRKNKGYGTACHLSALKARGPSAIHRKSFRPTLR